MRRAPWLLLLLLLGAAPPPSSGAVTGQVSVQAGGQPRSDRSGIVVFLDGVPDPDGPLPPHQIRQKDLAFAPAVSVVVRGTQVEFPNDDRVFHDVFSMSEPAKFDLGLYKSGTTRSVTFRRVGIVNIYCNIHPQMLAKVKVVPSRFYALTGVDGRFQIAGVPPGSYSWAAWPRAGAEVRGRVTVTAGEAARLTIAVVESPESRVHLRRDGTPYLRYR